jgi:hypothetical protein
MYSSIITADSSSGQRTGLLSVLRSLTLGMAFLKKIGYRRNIGINFNIW